MADLFTVLMIFCTKLPIQICTSTIVTEEQCKTVVRTTPAVVRCIDKEGRIMVVHQ